MSTRPAEEQRQQHGSTTNMFRAVAYSKAVAECALHKWSFILRTLGPRTLCHALLAPSCAVSTQSKNVSVRDAVCMLVAYASFLPNDIITQELCTCENTL